MRFETVETYILVEIVVATLLRFLPLTFSLYYYYKLRIKDYLIFAIFWLASILMAITIVLKKYYTSELLYWQLREIIQICLAYSLLLHAARSFEQNQKAAKLLTVSGLIYAIFLIVLVGFWTNTSTQQHVFHIATFTNITSGLVLVDTIVYSPSFPFLRSIFTSLAFMFFFSVYWTIKPIHQTARIKKAVILWRCGTAIALIRIIITDWIAIFFNINPIIGFAIGAFSSLFFAAIVIFIPEGLIITYSRVATALKLHEQLSKEKKRKYASENLHDYLISVKQIMNEDS